MVGILDDKKRVLDSLITREGRRQIVGGDLRIRFAAFSDRNAFYQGDIISGSNDASERLYFETTSMPQDRVTFEADDSGRLLPIHATKVVENNCTLIIYCEREEDLVSIKLFSDN